MSKHLFDVNGDIIHTISHDEMTDKTTVASTQDVDPYLKANKEERESQTSITKMGDGLQKIASIPLTVIEIWRKELGSDPLSQANRGWLMRKLQSPDFAKLRTRNGRFL